METSPEERGGNAGQSSRCAFDLVGVTLAVITVLGHTP